MTKMPPTKHDLKSNIERVYFHNPYIAKTSVVDIVQFIERFIRFELFHDIHMFGVSDHRNWERLVRNYLEEVHSFIDLQRRTFSAVENLLDKDLAVERKVLIEPIPIDSLIIKELRNRVHHESNHLIFISETVTTSGVYPAIPLVMLNWNWFSQQELIDRVKEVMTNPERLWLVFGNHCDHFVNSSNKIGNMLLEKLGFPNAKAPRKYGFKTRN